MPGWESIRADLIGVSIVVFVLFAIAFIVRMLFALQKSRQQKSEAAPAPADLPLEQAAPEVAQHSQGGLKLVQVDEKTAALIMAIVSHESGIHLSELNFKRISLLNS